MTLTEYGKLVKSNNYSKLVLVKYGNFYRCFDNDALMMFYLFNYKISENYHVGFPIKIIDKILIKLKESGISVILINGLDETINYEIINNKYDWFLTEAKKHYNYISGVNIIMEDVKECLTKDLNNIGSIRNFIKNL